MKALLIIVFICILNINLDAQKTARIGAKIYGYDGNTVDFEFVEVLNLLKMRLII